MKIGKKIVCILMVVLMCLMAAPLSGFVDFDWPKIDWGIKVSALSSSGKCGANVTYTYNSSTGKLVISGKGEMYDYSWSMSPFYDSNIKSVVIESGVTSVGDLVFVDCFRLASITIVNSVTSIGEGAFWDCISLTSVTIPDSVKSIGNSAFSDCTGLTSVNIPDSVKSIGNSAFSGCTGLTSVNIPDSVESIGNVAFSDCTSLTSVTVDRNNAKYSSDSYGVLFNKKKTVLIQYPIGNKRTSYKILNSVTSIGDGAFSGCTGLTSVNIPDSVKSISYFAFSGCSGLTSITIPNSVTSMGDHVFERCTNLTSAAIPDSVTSMCHSAFSGCTSLTSLTIPNSVTSIGDQAFYECTGLRSVTIGNSVTSIGEAAFHGCTSLTSVTIPDSVTSIDDTAFYECTGLRSVTIGNSVTSIGAFAFIRCSRLKSITISNSVARIGPSAFSNCSNLTDVYYAGSKKEWNAISISGGNDELTNATIHYNYKTNIPKAVTNLKAFNATTSSITLSWSKSSGATGYRIFKYNAAKKKYEAVKTIGTLSYKVTKLSAGTTYYFKVRPYCKVADGTVIWGSYSKTVSVTTKKNAVVKVAPETANIYIGNTKTLTATTNPNNLRIAWKSGDTSIASVSSSGVVTAKKAGTVTIMATCKYKNKAYTSSCKVTVKTPKVTLNKKSANLVVGGSFTLKATVSPSSAKVSWKSSDTSIATVSSSGVVTAKKAGTVTITATCKYKNKAYTSSCKVTVKTPKVTLNKKSANLVVGDSLTLKATVLPSCAKVSWKSSNTAVATVSSTGKVTAKNTGSTTITASITYNGKTYKANCKIKSTKED